MDAANEDERWPAVEAGIAADEKSVAPKTTLETVVCDVWQWNQLGERGVRRLEGDQRRLDLRDIEERQDLRSRRSFGVPPILRPRPLGGILPPSKRSPLPISSRRSRALAERLTPTSIS